MRPTPYPIDIDGPWWRGYYRGWHDHDAGRHTVRATPRDPLWSAGYHAGWAAAGPPTPIPVRHADPTWN